MIPFNIFSKTQFFVFLCSLILIPVVKAQTPLVIQFDGLHQKMLPTKVAVCSDGGYILAQISDNNFNSTPYLIKTDSVGGIEWSRHFLALPGVSNFNKITRNVIQLPDSGFLYVGTILDPMFGTYEGSSFHRLDRFGNIISAKGPIPGGAFTTGYGIQPCFYDNESNSAMGFSHYYEYNGTNGTCCDKYFIWKLDTNLNPVMVNEIIEPPNTQLDLGVMQKIILNGTFAGYVTGSKNGARVMMFDTTNNLLWSKVYGYGRINKIIQDDSSLVILGVNESNNVLLNAYIHRIDLNGITLSIHELLAADKIWPVDIIRKDSVYLIAALATPRIPIWSGYLNPRGLMISIDITGNILQSFCSSDSLFTFAGLDTLRKDFLFARGYDPSVTSGFQILRLSLDSTACGFIPYNIITTSPTITTNTIIRNTAFDSLAMAQATQLYYDSVITSTLVCGFTSLNEYTLPGQWLDVYPSPTKEVLNIGIESYRSKSDVIIVYDISGREVYKKTLDVDENHLKIMVTDWHIGIYFVRYLNGEDGITRKFIKN